MYPPPQPLHVFHPGTPDDRPIWHSIVEPTGVALSNMAARASLTHADYTVGWICALPLEMAAAKAMLDEIHGDLPVQPNDHNSYILGCIGNHNTVVACLPNGEYGITSAAIVATQLLSSFRSIRFGLMVGIGGGVPSADVDIRLGDIVVGRPTETHGGVIQYDFGKELHGGFKRTGMLNRPPQPLLTALSKLQAIHLTEGSRIPDFVREIRDKIPNQASTFARPSKLDRLFLSRYAHVDMNSKTCESCDGAKVVPRRHRSHLEPVIHYGLIGSANKVVKNSSLRDKLGKDLGVYCVEMEAAGLMNTYPCLVIRGICDYADSHKNKAWQGYAAAVAAAFAKELLSVISATAPMPEPVSSSEDQSESRGYFAKKRRREILAWLSQTPYKKTHARIRQPIVEGTGTWILSKPEFLQWEKSPSSTVFWLRGLPGSGKTTITSTLIQRISHETQEHQTQPLHFFYCSSNDEYSNSPLSILLTFLHQNLACLPVGHNLVEEKCESWMTNGLDEQSISLEEAWMLYRESTTQFQGVYIIIDGLDEIEPIGRHQLLDILHRLTAESASCYKIFISCRDNAATSYPFKSQSSLRIQPSDNTDDIRKLVHKRTANDAPLALLQGKATTETRQYLRHVLTQRAQGMFLWVELQLGELTHATTERELVDMINEFPGDLEATYQKILARVDALGHTKRLLAWTVMELLTFAEELIALDGMTRAIEGRTKHAGLYAEDMDPDMIIHVCCNMVTYDSQLDTLQLIHPTARTYLRKVMSSQLVHAWIAEACLRDLLRCASLLEIPSFSSHEPIGAGHPVNFTLYAAMNWHYHSRNCMRTPAYQTVESEFLRHPRAPRVWIRILKGVDSVHNRRIKTLLGFLQAFSNPTDSLFIAACFFGLKDLFRIIYASPDLSGPTRPRILAYQYIRKCISWAGHFVDSSTLIFYSYHRFGKEMDARGKIQGSADVSAADGSEVIASLFRIAQILGDPVCAAAICAAEQGHHEIFKHLWTELDRQRSDIVFVVGDCCRLLATAGHHFEVLKYIDLPFVATFWRCRMILPFSFVGRTLIGLSACLGSVDMLKYWKAKMMPEDKIAVAHDLKLAVERDDERATKLLLEHTDIDINANCPGTEAAPALHLAASRGYHRVIKVLLRHPSIEVNTRAGYGQTALMEVEDNGPAVAALCSHKDLDIQIRNDLGLTACQIFIRNSHIEALAVLAKHPSFDVNERNNWGETPLITAVRLRRIEVVTTLLKVPAVDVAARDDNGVTALDIATRMDHAPLIWILSQPKGSLSFYLGRTTEDLSRALLRRPIGWR